MTLYRTPSSLRRTMSAAFDMNSTFGAFFISVVIAAAYGHIRCITKTLNSLSLDRLCGVMCIQVFFYFQNYGSDNLLVKASVRFFFRFYAETAHKCHSYR
jgi:hypothetical protein